LAHPWLNTDGKEVQLKIGQKLNELNNERRELMKKFKPDDSEMALEEAKGRLTKGKKNNSQ